MSPAGSFEQWFNMHEALNSNHLTSTRPDKQRMFDEETKINKARSRQSALGKFLWLEATAKRFSAQLSPWTWQPKHEPPRIQARKHNLRYPRMWSYFLHKTRESTSYARKLIESQGQLNRLALVPHLCRYLKSLDCDSFALFYGTVSFYDNKLPWDAWTAGALIDSFRRPFYRAA